MAKKVILDVPEPDMGGGKKAVHVLWEGESLMGIRGLIAERIGCGNYI